MQRRRARVRRCARTDSIAAAAKTLVCLHRRRLSTKTSMARVCAEVRRPQIAIQPAAQTPHRASGARVATPSAPAAHRRASQLSLQGATCNIASPCAAAALAAKKGSKERARSLLQGFFRVLEQLYGSSFAHQIMARAMRSMDGSSAGAVLRDYTAPAVVGACLRLGVALELGQLEWDGIERSATVRWSSRKAPVFMSASRQRGLRHSISITMLSARLRRSGLRLDIVVATHAMDTRRNVVVFGCHWPRLVAFLRTARKGCALTKRRGFTATARGGTRWRYIGRRSSLIMLAPAGIRTRRYAHPRSCNRSTKSSRSKSLGPGSSTWRATSWTSWRTGTHCKARRPARGRTSRRAVQHVGRLW